MIKPEELFTEVFEWKLTPGILESSFNHDEKEEVIAWVDSEGSYKGLELPDLKDWNTMGMVIERMAELGFYLQTVNFDPKVKQVYFVTNGYAWFNDIPKGLGEAPTLPEAVYSAALAAVRGMG